MTITPAAPNEHAPVDPVLFWRPGCPYCHRLQHALDQAGVAIAEVNIWEHPEAAALVRSVAGGNETVPTLLVGHEALVNPDPEVAIAAIAAHRALRARRG